MRRLASLACALIFSMMNAGNAALASCTSVDRSPLNVGASGTYLTDMAGTSINDVWAVGAWFSKNGLFHPLVEHYDGRSWKRVPAPSDPNLKSDVLYSIAAYSSSDAWAVGFRYLNSFGCHLPFALHWDGASWTENKVPDIGCAMQDDLTSVAVNPLNANDVWAVGYTSQTLTPNFPFAEHWNGKRWTYHDLPNPKNSGPAVLGVSVAPTGHA